MDACAMATCQLNLVILQTEGWGGGLARLIKIPRTIAICILLFYRTRRDTIRSRV